MGLSEEEESFTPFPLLLSDLLLLKTFPLPAGVSLAFLNELASFFRFPLGVLASVAAALALPFFPLGDFLVGAMALTRPRPCALQFVIGGNTRFTFKNRF